MATSSWGKEGAFAGEWCGEVLGGEGRCPRRKGGGSVLAGKRGVSSREGWGPRGTRVVCPSTRPQVMDTRATPATDGSTSTGTS